MKFLRNFLTDDYMPYIKMICSINVTNTSELVFNHRWREFPPQPSVDPGGLYAGVGPKMIHLGGSGAILAVLMPRFKTMWSLWVTEILGWMGWWKVKVKDGGEGMNLTILPKKNREWFPFSKKKLTENQLIFITGLWAGVQKGQTKNEPTLASTRFPKVWHDEPGVRSFAPWPYGNWRVGRWSNKKTMSCWFQLKTYSWESRRVQMEESWFWLEYFSNPEIIQLHTVKVF